MEKDSDPQFEFEKWFVEKGLSINDPIVPLLKNAWNKSLKLACDWFGENEGVDYSAWERFHVE